MSGYTSADLTAIRQAIAKGATRVKMGDEEVQYRSLAEMKQIASDIEGSLNGRRMTRHYPHFSRGT